MSLMIINADDLGYSPAVNQAIVDLHQAGLVTSTSLLVNQPFSGQAAAMARAVPDLSLGVHLNLSKGRPMLPPARVPSLVDGTGSFWNSNLFYRHALLGRVNWQEAAAELDAQVQWAVEQGLRLDNLDTHVHFHMLPPARRLTLELAGRYGVPAWRTPEPRATLLPSKLWVDLLAMPSADTWDLMAPHFLLSLHQWGERLMADPQLAELFRRPGLVTELVVHPGYLNDPHLPLPDQLPPQRRQFEVDLLRGPAFATWLEETGLRLISFADLRNATTI